MFKLAFLFSAALFAYDGEPTAMTSHEKPAEFKDIGITENLGASLDPEMTFKDENGETVKLGKFYDGKHPVVLSLVYYSCPGLCNFHLNGVVDSLKQVDWTAGEKYQMLAISFDPTETPETAAGKRKSYLEVYNRPAGDKGWHFLTADEATIKQLTEKVGFKYKWSEEAKEWMHASAAIVTTPKGVIARYLHGIQFEPKTFRLALNEAADGKIGTIVDKLVWYCFKYDPHTSKYTLYAFRLVQLGGLFIILVLALVLIPVWRRALRSKGE